MANSKKEPKRHIAKFSIDVNYSANFGYALTDKELEEFKAMEGKSFDNLTKGEKKQFHKLYDPVCEKFAEYIMVTLVEMEVESE